MKIAWQPMTTCLLLCVLATTAAAPQTTAAAPTAAQPTAPATAPIAGPAAALPDGVTMTMLQDRVRHYTFTSAALRKPMAFTVVVPADFSDAGGPWPVLFILHGLGRHERTLIDDPASRERLLSQPYVIVLPKGENGWYFDSPFDPQRQYASYLDEVVELAGKVLPISHERERRAIGGWSAGGFGAVWACIRKPESFSSLATVIAVVDYPAPGVRFAIPEKTFGADPAAWPKFNPLNRAAELKGTDVLLVIGKAASDAAMNERLSAALKTAGIEHEVIRVSGGHTFPTVQAGIGHILEFTAKHFAKAAEQGPATRPAGESRSGN